MPTKAHPTVMCGYESWTIKNTEDWRIDAFEPWFKRLCWRRLLRVRWTARRPNQFILNEIFPEYSLEGLMLKLKLQYLGHLLWRTDSLEKTLMLGRIEGQRRRGQQRLRWLDGITGWTWVWVNSGSCQWTGRPGLLQSMGSQSRTWLSDWTELKWTEWFIFLVRVLVRTPLVVAERKLSPGRKRNNTRERIRKLGRTMTPAFRSNWIWGLWMFGADIIILDFHFSCPLFAVQLLLLLLQMSFLYSGTSGLPSSIEAVQERALLISFCSLVEKVPRKYSSELSMSILWEGKQC